MKNHARNFDDGRCPGPGADFPKRLENCLDTDLGSVTLRPMPAVEAIEAGPLAATRGETIFVSNRLLRRPRHVVETVLAHEFVHVVQQRLGRRTHSRQQGQLLARALEAEADNGARAFREGRKFRPAVADSVGVPRCWGPAGHYYTVYFVMLAAGVPGDIAMLRAFGCQLPDQVLQFDATAAALDANVNANSLFFREGIRQAGFNTANPWQDGESAAQKELRLRQDAEVESGLHSLTGASSSNEQSYRAKVLKELFRQKDHLAIGLALHAFGDAFAHVQLLDPNLMYKCGIGHAAELVNANAQNRMLDSLIAEGFSPSVVASALSEIMKHSHDPDDVTNRLFGRQMLYRSYVFQLYEISKSFGGKAKLPASFVCELLGNFPALWTPHGEEQNDVRVIHQIRAYGSQFLANSMNTYWPENEQQVYFKRFYMNHHKEFGAIGYSGELGFVMATNRIRELGARWARGFTKASFTP